MLKLSNKKVGVFDLFVILFSTAWILIILLDYLNKHPIYLESFTNFKFYKLSIFLIVYGVLFTWVLTSKQKFLSKYRPFIFIPLALISFFICILAMAISYSKYYVFDIEAYSYLYLLYSAGFILLSGFLILFACFCLGHYITKQFLVQRVIAKSHFTIDLALGIMLFTFILFPLAWFHMLYYWVLGPILLAMLALNYKIAIKTIKQIFNLFPDFNKLQYALLYLIGIFVTFNFVFVISPYPLGFDSRNYYINLSQLIAQNHGFVHGFQPHNWELFISAGKVIFGKIEISMFLSYIGGILAALSLYHFTNNIIKITKTTSLVITLIFIATPAISHQMFVEFKVDLALLYFQMVTITLFLTHIRYKNIKPKAKWSFAIFIGVLLGFGLGIKLLNFFLIYGLFSAFAIDKKNMFPIFSIILGGLGTILFLEIDSQTGLRTFHKYVEPISYILMFSAVLCAIYYSYQNFEKAKKMYLQLLVMNLFAIVCFSPWIYKSSIDTGSKEILKLVRGASPSHIINYQLMDQKFKELQNSK